MSTRRRMNADTNLDGAGPAWSNSLFEEHAEFGIGFQPVLDGHVTAARELVMRLEPQIGERLAAALLDADQTNEVGIAVQRQRVAELRRLLAGVASDEARRLESLADGLVRKSVQLTGDESPRGSSGRFPIWQFIA